jgi:hypothetical protein
MRVEGPAIRLSGKGNRDVRIATIAIVALFAFGGVALAAEERSIETIDPGSGTVELNDGTTYHTDDPIDTWNEGDTVLVPSSGDRLINKDEDEGVDATQD